MVTKMGERVKVKCNRCQNEMFSDEFVIDPDYQMAVCPNCVREKKQKREVWNEVSEERKAKEPKPIGWDEDDELLEKLYRQKQREKEQGTGFKSVGFGKIKCDKCGYAFKYSEDLHKPSSCPYCFNPIRRKSRF